MIVEELLAALRNRNYEEAKKLIVKYEADTEAKFDLAEVINQPSFLTALHFRAADEDIIRESQELAPIDQPLSAEKTTLSYPERVSMIDTARAQEAKNFVVWLQMEYPGFLRKFNITSQHIRCLLNEPLKVKYEDTPDIWGLYPCHYGVMINGSQLNPAIISPLPADFFLQSIKAGYYQGINLVWLIIGYSSYEYFLSIKKADFQFDLSVCPEHPNHPDKNKDLSYFLRHDELSNILAAYDQGRLEEICEWLINSKVLAMPGLFQTQFISQLPPRYQIEVIACAFSRNLSVAIERIVTLFSRLDQYEQIAKSLNIALLEEKEEVATSSHQLFAEHEDNRKKSTAVDEEMRENKNEFESRKLKEDAQPIASQSSPATKSFWYQRLINCIKEGDLGDYDEAKKIITETKFEAADITNYPSLLECRELAFLEGQFFIQWLQEHHPCFLAKLGVTSQHIEAVLRKSPFEIKPESTPDIWGLYPYHYAAMRARVNNVLQLPEDIFIKTITTGYYQGINLAWILAGNFSDHFNVDDWMPVSGSISSHTPRAVARYKSINFDIWPTHSNHPDCGKDIGVRLGNTALYWLLINNSQQFATFDLNKGFRAICLAEDCYDWSFFVELHERHPHLFESLNYQAVDKNQNKFTHFLIQYAPRDFAAEIITRHPQAAQQIDLNDIQLWDNENTNTIACWLVAKDNWGQSVEFKNQQALDDEIYRVPILQALLEARKPESYKNLHLFAKLSITDKEDNCLDDQRLIDLTLGEILVVKKQWLILKEVLKAQPHALWQPVTQNMQRNFKQNAKFFGELLNWPESREVLSEVLESCSKERIQEIYQHIEKANAYLIGQVKLQLVKLHCRELCIKKETLCDEALKMKLRFIFDLADSINDSLVRKKLCDELGDVLLMIASSHNSPLCEWVIKTAKGGVFNSPLVTMLPAHYQLELCALGYYQQGANRKEHILLSMVAAFRRLHQLEQAIKPTNKPVLESRTESAINVSLAAHPNAFHGNKKRKKSIDNIQPDKTFGIPQPAESEGSWHAPLVNLKSSRF